MKNKLKKIAISLNLSRKILGYMTKNAGIIMMYHRFSDRTANRRIHADIFEEQLRILAQEFNVINLEEYIDRRIAGQAFSNEAVITVDDGYFDFFKYAYPALLKYKLPATLFITSDFLEEKIWLWWDAIEYILREARSDNMLFKYRNWSFNIKKRHGIYENWNKIADACMKIDERKRCDLIKRLSEILEVDLPTKPPKEYSSITTEQAKIMLSNGISIGCHTKTHPVLNRLNTQDLENEIIFSKNRLEELLDVEIDLFCYPYGRPDDVSDEIVKTLKKAGYRGAVVTYLGDLSRNFDPFRIARHGVGNNIFEFQWKLYGGELVSKKLKQTRIFK